MSAVAWAGRLDLAASFLFGGAGAVTLGSLTFREFEVPESIPWGGQQQTTVHKFPGGSRQIDAMGRDDRSLDWSGVFLSGDAVYRARAVDQMRIDGEAIALSWAGFSYQVVIGSFEPDYRRSSHIPYRISCIVLKDNAGETQGSFLTSAVQVLADVNLAVGYVSNLTTGGLSGALTAALGVATGAAATASASGFILGSADYGGAVSAVQGAGSALAGAASGLGNTLSGIVARSPLGGLVSGASDLTSALSAAGDLAKVTVARSLIGRALTNAVVGAT